MRRAAYRKAFELKLPGRDGLLASPLADSFQRSRVAIDSLRAGPAVEKWGWASGCRPAPNGRNGALSECRTRPRGPSRPLLHPSKDLRRQCLSCCTTGALRPQNGTSGDKRRIRQAPGSLRLTRPASLAMFRRPGSQLRGISALGGRLGHDGRAASISLPTPIANGSLCSESWRGSSGLSSSAGGVGLDGARPRGDLVGARLTSILERTTIGGLCHRLRIDPAVGWINLSNALNTLAAPWAELRWAPVAANTSAAHPRTSAPRRPPPQHRGALPRV